MQIKRIFQCISLSFYVSVFADNHTLICFVQTYCDVTIFTLLSLKLLDLFGLPGSSEVPWTLHLVSMGLNGLKSLCFTVPGDYMWPLICSSKISSHLQFSSHQYLFFLISSCYLVVTCIVTKNCEERDLGLFSTRHI